MQLDSGADVTLIDTQTWVKIGSPELSKPATTIGAANGTEIEVVGEFEVNFTCAGFQGRGRCFVTKNTNQLLGIEWMEQLPPITKAFEVICCKIEEKPSKAVIIGKSTTEAIPNGFQRGIRSLQKEESSPSS